MSPFPKFAELQGGEGCAGTWGVDSDLAFPVSEKMSAEAKPVPYGMAVFFICEVGNTCVVKQASLQTSPLLNGIVLYL